MRFVTPLLLTMIEFSHTAHGYVVETEDWCVGGLKSVSDQLMIARLLFWDSQQENEAK